MENNTTTTAAPLEIADSKRNEDVNSIYAASDTITGMATRFSQVLMAYKYPSVQLADLKQALSNVNEELTRAANFILNPEAAEIAPDIEKRIKCGID